MKKLCLITVWMGELPDTYAMWLMSAKKNPTVDFFLISDRVENKVEKNIHFVHEEIGELKARFQALFSFPIKLNSAYKICDYKPVYGSAFPEIVEGYDYWGHVDLDIIFGDLRHFLTDEFLEQYEKVFDAGYFILYRNTKEVNERYRVSECDENMAYPYRKAFQTDYACFFDEYLGMSILGMNYFKTFRDQLTETMIYDFDWKQLGFQSYITFKYFVYSWKNGKLFVHDCDRYGVEIASEGKECLFVHIQKRKMKTMFPKELIPGLEEFWIVPNCYRLDKPSEPLFSEKEAVEYAKAVKKRDKRTRCNNLWRNGLLQYIPHAVRSKRIRRWIINVKGFY